MAAVCFGSISTLADTSELQRRAFNDAFEQHGLDWNWSREEYRELLEKSGGAQRVEEYAASSGEAVDAKAVHATKSALYQKYLKESGVEARPGVVETIRAAKEGGMKVALVTTTSPENVSALIEALNPAIERETFDVVVDSSVVEESKPDAASYEYALTELEEDVSGCVAIEDNVEGVKAAKAAGISCVAFPNENTAAHDFPEADGRLDRLDLSALKEFTAGE